MQEQEAVAKLQATLRDAKAVIAAGGRYLTIVSKPSAMRALGLRGTVLSENHNGTKAYSVLAHRVVERLPAVLRELGGAD